MPFLSLILVNLMTSLNITLYYHNMADVCNRSECIINNPHLVLKGMQEKESIMVWGVDRKICPSGSYTAISRQTSWCYTHRDGLFYVPLTPMIDAYSLSQFPKFMSMRRWNSDHDCTVIYCSEGGTRLWRRCRVSYVTGASNWYWVTAGQGLQKWQF